MSFSSRLVKSALVLLIVQICLISEAWADRDYDDCYYDYDDHEWHNCNLAVGVIIAIVVGVLIFMIVIVVLLCYLCACCCFIGRRGKTRGQVYAPPAPITIQGSTPGVTVVNGAYQPSGFYPNQPPQYNQQYQPQQFQQSTPYPLYPQQQQPQPYPPQPQPQRF